MKRQKNKYNNRRKKKLHQRKNLRSSIILKLLLILLSICIGSYGASAQGLDDVFAAIDETMGEVDRQVDTGFQADENQYGFGAEKQISNELKLNLGVGAMLNKSQEHGLSTSQKPTGVQDTRTNAYEDDFNPTNISPMVGMKLGYKF